VIWRALLRRSLPADRREDVDADLAEELTARAAESSPRAARRWYRRQVLAFLGRSMLARGRRTGPFPHTTRRHALQTLSHDLRLAVRSLLASRTQSGIAVLTLALGIGVNTAAFSVLDAVLLRPMPFADADRYVEIWNHRPETGSSYPRFSRELLLEWRTQTDLFDRVEAYEFDSVVWKGPAGTQMALSAYVTPGLLPMLGVPPLEGRLFAAGDGRDDSDAAVVISEAFWREQLGRAPDIVGSSLSVNRRPHVVIGVMPSSFRFPYADQALWLPRDLAQPPVEANLLSMTAFARLRQGGSLRAAEQQVAVRGEALAVAAGSTVTGLTARLDFRGRFLDPRTRRSLVVLWGAVALLLLIVCANVASLSLSGVLQRSRDFAVRAALGARRLDLIRESLTESAVVGLAGAGLGLLVGLLTLDVVVASLPSAMTFTSLNAIELDGRVLAFTTLAGVGTAIVFGLPAALMASRPAGADAMRRGSRSVAGSTASRRFRSGLVIAEVTLALVLLVGAALMGRSFARLQAVDRGFDTAGLVALDVGFPAAGYHDPRARDRFTAQLIDRLRSVPGILGATAGAVPPGASRIRSGSVEFTHAPAARADALMLPIYDVWPTYFDEVGVPLIEGRAFEPGETADALIVSASFARTYWPAGSAVGGRLRFGGAETWRTVIGVAGEVRQWKMDDATGAFEWYEPLQTPAGAPPPEAAVGLPPEEIVGYRTFAIRAEDPAGAIRLAERAVHAIDEDVVIWQAGVVERLFHDAVAEPRVALFMLLVLAGLGLVLAAGGLYGVLSHLVAQRLREIGIRLALGAQPGDIFRLVLRAGLVLTGVGVVAGVALAAGLTRVMRAMLYDVEPTDPTSIAVVVVVVLATALFASWRPARRAMRVDPATLLRES
jgi:putative ABC transport system permease protein